MTTDTTKTYKNDKLVNEKTSEEEQFQNIPVELMKHPLEHVWSFWMFTNFEQKSWKQNLVLLTTFDTVEDYWCLYHHMKLPSELKFGQDYAIFKNGIRPMWEDSANSLGGRWLISFERKRNISLDAAWSLVVLLMIGENFENSDGICGAVVNVRVKSKVGVWLKDASNKGAVLEIGQKLKANLGLDAKINFHEHNRVSNLFTM